MKGIKKYLVAVCVLALSGVLLAGCSGQASSSAASASGSASASSASASASASASSASAASTEDLIKEIEAIPGLEDAKSVTVEMKGLISIDLSGMEAALSESGSASSASADSASASAASTMDIPTDISIKVDKSQQPEKIYFSLDLMGIPFEMYITGDNVVLVMQGQAFGGTLQDLEALGMSQYSSVESVMSSSGAGSFDQYKDAIKGITKETVDGDTVYTVLVDTAKVAGDDAMQTLAQSGITGDLNDFVLTYTVGADGKLAAASIEMTGTGFSFVQNLVFSDYDKTVVPDAPEATMNISEIAGAMGSAAGASQAAA